MKIGIIGSGSVGGTLGKRWAKNGHQVIFAARSDASDKLKSLLKETGAKSGTAAEAARESEVVLLATPWPNTEDAVRSAGSLAGKILIDATNPLLADLSALSLGTTTSAGEQVAKWASGANVVKAFNTVGFNIMANPAFPQGKPVLFYCGDDAGAKSTVAKLVSELGFDAVDAGPLRQARVLEPLAMLWISLAYAQKQGPEIAFQFMRR